MVFLNDMDNVSDIRRTFLFLNEIFKRPYNEKTIRYRDSYLYNARCFLTTISTMMSYIIGYTYERCKDYSDDLIDNVLSTFSFWNTIKCNKELSSIEKFKQFRNCFEHANFLTGYNDSVKCLDGIYYVSSLEDIKFHFKNSLIEGEIDFIEFVNLYEKCVDLFTKYNADNKIAMYILDADTIRNPYKIRSRKELERVLNGIAVRDIQASYNANNTSTVVTIDDRRINDFRNQLTSVRNYSWHAKDSYTDPSSSMLRTIGVANFINNKESLGLNQIDIVTRRISEDEKEKIRRHFIYLTNNFKRPYSFSDDFIHQVFTDDNVCYKAKDIIISMFSELLTGSYNKYSLYGFQKRLLEKYSMPVSEEDIVSMAPGLYFTSIICEANFFLNYAHEVNKKVGNELFKYFDISLDGIDILNNSDSKIVRNVDPLEDKKRELERLQKEKDGLPKKLDWAQKQLVILNNPKNKDPNKHQKLEDVSNFIENYDELKRELEEKISIIMETIRKGNLETYTDSYHLFRHLRNSIAHGRFNVSFDQGYERNDLGESIIKFYDVSSDDLDNPDITITMSLNRFEELIKSIGKIVTKYTNQTDFESLSMHIIDEKLI